MAKTGSKPRYATVRIGEAAGLLGVSVDPLGRWAAAGRLPVRRTAGGQRLVGLRDIRLLQAKRRRMAPPTVTQSARNRFPGLVTRVEADRVAAVVEVQAGAHPLVSLMTAEAATDLALRPGTAVVCVVKATNVVVELARRGRGST